jgi:hypothetical protein
MRPFYSTLHNLAGLGVQLLAFSLALISSRHYKNKAVLFIWLVFFIQLGLVALTWSDWDNRWGDRMMPLITLLAAAGGVVGTNRILGIK